MVYLGETGERRKGGMRRKITIYDLARLTDVSPTQVSRALNGMPKVAPEIRARILETAKKLNYRNMAKNHIPRIAVVTSGADLYNYRFLHCLFKEADERGWGCFVVSLSQIDKLTEYICDGVIALSVMDNFSTRWFQIAALPMVVINGYGFNIEGIPSVDPDRYDESYIVLKHLKELGHSRIARIHEFNVWNSEEGKRRGDEEFMRAASDLNLPARNISFLNGEDWRNIFSSALKQGFTAFFVIHTYMAVRAQTTLISMGLRIPEEISLVTYEIEHVSSFLDPPATTLDFDYGALAKRAVAELVLRMRKQTDSGKSVIAIPNILTVRKSTAPPRKFGKFY